MVRRLGAATATGPTPPSSPTSQTLTSTESAPVHAACFSRGKPDDHQDPAHLHRPRSTRPEPGVAGDLFVVDYFEHWERLPASAVTLRGRLVQ